MRPNYLTSWLAGHNHENRAGDNEASDNYNTDLKLFEKE
jgi:hypothetical protein